MSSCVYCHKDGYLAEHREDCPRYVPFEDRPKCAFEGCENRLVGTTDRKYCHSHKRYHSGNLFVSCVVCGKELLGVISLCEDCHKNTFVLCACGCGNYLRKFTRSGLERSFISGHNKGRLGTGKEPFHKVCAVCRKAFDSYDEKAKLCSIPCRIEWFKINPPRAKKRVTVPCAVCGTEILRYSASLESGVSPCCSQRCRNIVVALKVKGKLTVDTVWRQVLRRDSFACRICGFSSAIHVHHIIFKSKGGEDTLENLIVLCPNHHAMAHRKLITVEPVPEEENLVFRTATTAVV